MSFGPTWQQPPTYAAPRATQSGASVTSYDAGPTQLCVPLSQPWPLLG